MWCRGQDLLQLLLGSEVVAVAAGLLPAVGGPGVEPGVALPADHLVAVVLLGEDPEAGLNDAATQPQHQVEGGLLLDVVVRQSPAELTVRGNLNLIIKVDTRTLN